MIQHRTLSISAWMDACKDGVYLTVRIPLAGHSMWPLIRRERDCVTVAPLRRSVIVGDIVLFRRQDGAFVVHRVYRINGDSVITLGDACEHPDVPIHQEAICGLVTHVERNGKNFHLDNARWRCMGRLWMAGLPLRWAVFNVLRRIKRRAYHG